MALHSAAQTSIGHQDRTTIDQRTPRTATVSPRLGTSVPHGLAHISPQHLPLSTLPNQGSNRNRTRLHVNDRRVQRVLRRPSRTQAWPWFYNREWRTAWEPDAGADRLLHRPQQGQQSWEHGRRNKRTPPRPAVPCRRSRERTQAHADTCSQQHTHTCSQKNMCTRTHLQKPRPPHAPFPLSHHEQ